MDMDETGKPILTDGVGGRSVDDLVECAGCTQVSGSPTPIRHLPPACQYDQTPFNKRAVAVEGTGDAVTDLMRERLAKPDEVTIKRVEYDRLQSVAGCVSASWDTVRAGTALADKLALFFRAHYQAEIAAGAHSQFPDMADAVVHYLLIERDVTKRGWWGRVKFVLWGV